MKLTRSQKRNVEALRIASPDRVGSDQVTPLEVYLLNTGRAVRRYRRRTAVARWIDRLTAWYTLPAWLLALYLVLRALHWLSRLAPDVGAAP
ncbi:MAG: hypothetical protein AAGE65_13680 [Planctomycetota bacterium]